MTLARTPDQTDVRAILNALPAMVGYWDSDLRNRMANDVYVEFFGMTPEEMRGKHISEVLGPELYELNLPYLQRALAGEAQQFERAIPTPSGELRYTQASYVPDIVDGKVLGLFVLVTDITDRKRAEEEVERARARLAEAERIARVGSWEWDIPSNHVSWSPGLCEIYGIAPEEFGSRYEPGADRVFAEDRERVDAEVRRALETCAPLDVEYRIVRPDGRIRQVHGRAEVIADADGRPLRMVGTAQDVTEVRATAEALHQTSAELSRRAAELQRRGAQAGPTKDELRRALTARQLEILALMGEGMSNADIADRLFLGESTVKWHVRKILRALDVPNRAQAVARYLAAPD
ncbi:MAG TPA: PAS domain-containing protein [Burkholderiaceae bacterium]|nr:PAS domain-containing protein [Burkholderiaceae bacterium]